MPPPLTITVTDPTERLLVEQALAFARELRQTASTWPDGSVLRNAGAFLRRPRPRIPPHRHEDRSGSRGRRGRKKGDPARRCPCGFRRDNKGRKGQQVLTAVGGIDLSRLHLVCVSPARRDSVQPLDDRLGLTESLTESARRLLGLAGASWSFGSASRHLKTFCGLDASDEFIRRVAESAVKKPAVWMDESPAATGAFEVASGEAEFETDGTTVNTTERWKEVKIGIFAKRERGESVETNRWVGFDLEAVLLRQRLHRRRGRGPLRAGHDDRLRHAERQDHVEVQIQPRPNSPRIKRGGSIWHWRCACNRRPNCPLFLTTPPTPTRDNSIADSGKSESPR